MTRPVASDGLGNGQSQQQNSKRINNAACGSVHLGNSPSRVDRFPPWKSGQRAGPSIIGTRNALSQMVVFRDSEATVAKITLVARRWGRRDNSRPAGRR